MPEPTPENRSVRIGVAGWALPHALRRRESAAMTLLEQYAEQFDAVEINSSFYRPHRAATYRRWAESVPPQFCFAVKAPRVLTHEKRLLDCHDGIAAFADAVAGLGGKLGIVLVQLPPSLSFDAPVARRFFETLRASVAVPIVCEARHPTWFAPDATRVLAAGHVMRVTADPVAEGCEISRCGEQPSYLRLHGSPRMYYSAYSAADIEGIAALIENRSAAKDVWCIFDNTAAGAAWDNAAALRARIPLANHR